MEKINVLQFICPTGFYGAERWVLALANNIDSSKIRCELAVTKEPGQQDLEILRQFQGDAFEVPMNGRFDLSAVAHLVKLISEREIDIIHTHGYKSDILGVIAAKKAGIKSISTPHGFENSKQLKLRIYVKLGCLSYCFFDKVAPLSEELCDYVSQTGLSRDKINYIQNGVDLKEVDTFLDKKAGAEISNSKHMQIGFIGQMITRKNVTDILDIFDRLWRGHNNLKLVLLGDGAQRSELESYAASLASAADIEFLGFRTDRLERLKDFDLFVMTSSYEGIPRCLMEAMAMKIPVAAYDIPGIDQLISHEETGLLAPFGDKDNLTKQWERLLFDRPYAAKIASEGRSFVQKHFSAERMAREYTALFEETLLNHKYSATQ